MTTHSSPRGKQTFNELIEFAMKNMQRYKTTLSLRKPPSLSRCHHCFPRELTSEKPERRNSTLIPVWLVVTTQNWAVLLWLVVPPLNQSSLHPNLGSSFDWLTQIFSCGTTNQKLYLAATHLKYGISALFHQTSFRGETSCGISKCRLFSQAIKHVNWCYYHNVAVRCGNLSAIIMVAPFLKLVFYFSGVNVCENFVFADREGK